jgi:hypothetical protein
MAEATTYPIPELEDIYKKLENPFNVEFDEYDQITLRSFLRYHAPEGQSQISDELKKLRSSLEDRYYKVREESSELDDLKKVGTIEYYSREIATAAISWLRKLPFLEKTNGEESLIDGIMSIDLYEEHKEAILDGMKSINNMVFYINRHLNVED